jgi:isopenicillin N synthase-like dioxygenase
MYGGKSRHNRFRDFRSFFTAILTMSSPLAQNAIPVIDLRQTDHGALVTQISGACRQFGFFGIVNHGIEALVIQRVFAASQKFFALSQTHKRALHINQSSCNRGFDPIGWQSLDLSKEGDVKAADLNESFYIGTEPQVDAPQIVSNHGENQWPDPSWVPGFNDDVNAYRVAVKNLSVRLMRLISESLGMRPEALDRFMTYPTCTTRLLFYPPQPTTDSHQIGAGAHTDWGAITVLAQDNAGGLEVKLPDGSWIHATPRDGMLIINTGDLMQRWTNDQYLSSWHRVINQHAGRARYSIAYFFDLDHHAVIETLPNCIDAEHPLKYPPITAGEHILDMYRRTTLA